MTDRVQRGRILVVTAAVVGSVVLLFLNGFAFLRGSYHPILALKLALWVAMFYALWHGSEVVRRGLIAVLGCAALACGAAAAVSGQAAVAAVALPLGLVCGATAALLAGPVVGAFLRAQRGTSP